MINDRTQASGDATDPLLQSQPGIDWAEVAFTKLITGAVERLLGRWELFVREFGLEVLRDHRVPREWEPRVRLIVSKYLGELQTAFGLGVQPQDVQQDVLNAIQGRLKQFLILLRVNFRCLANVPNPGTLSSQGEHFLSLLEATRVSDGEQLRTKIETLIQAVLVDAGGSVGETGKPGQTSVLSVLREAHETLRETPG